jgi:hypothetical protein
MGAVPVLGTGLEVFLEVFSGGESQGSDALAKDQSRNADDSAAAPPPKKGEIEPTQAWQPPADGGGAGGAGGDSGGAPAGSGGSSGGSGGGSGGSGGGGAGGAGGGSGGGI